MKTAVVTGAASGIGRETARLLLSMGYFVIGVARSPERARQTGMALGGGDGRLCAVVCDLSAMEAVRSAAAGIASVLRERGGRLDTLIHCAGAVSSRYVETPEAFEMQFAVNHLASFLLTRELMEPLQASPDARVLVVSSDSHYGARIRWDDVMRRRRYSCLGAYGQSKLCNVLFAAELARRAAGTSVCSYAIDPGLADTGIGHKGTAGVERLFWSVRRRRGLPARIPAGHIARIAASPEYAGRSGLYWKDGAPREPSRAARDPEEARRLWELSERLCGIGEGEADRCRDTGAMRAQVFFY